MRHTNNITCQLLMLAGILFFSSSTYARLRGDHLLGQVGLESGSQVPPGLYFVMIPAYLYITDKIENNNGDVISQPSISIIQQENIEKVDNIMQAWE